MSRKTRFYLFFFALCLFVSPVYSQSAPVPVDLPPLKAPPISPQDVSPFTYMTITFATVVCGHEWGLIQIKTFVPKIFEMWTDYGIDIDTQRRIFNNPEFRSAVNAEIKKRGGCKTILREMGYKL